MNIPKPVLQLLVKFAPQIVEWLYPKVSNGLDYVIKSAELQEGEDYVRLILAKDHNGWSAFIVAMSDEDKILRVIDKKNLQETVAQFVNMKDDLKDIKL